MSNEKLPYAHCTKAMPGQCDCAPFSHYEIREAEVKVKLWFNPDDNCEEWIVIHQGKIIANEPNMGHAIAIAGYELMNESRKQAMQSAIEHEQRLGNPKFRFHTGAEGELICCMVPKPPQATPSTAK